MSSSVDGHHRGGSACCARYDMSFASVLKFTYICSTRIKLDKESLKNKPNWSNSA